MVRQFLQNAPNRVSESLMRDLQKRQFPNSTFTSGTVGMESRYVGCCRCGQLLDQLLPTGWCDFETIVPIGWLIFDR
jgi:hypothetical protein